MEQMVEDIKRRIQMLEASRNILRGQAEDLKESLKDVEIQIERHAGGIAELKTFLEGFEGEKEQQSDS